MRNALLFAALVAACRPPAPPACAACAELAAETRRWHDERIADLRADLGWLTLAGLYWLGDGEHRLGSAADADIVFPEGAPADIGTLTRVGSDIHLRVASGVDARIGDAAVADTKLRADADRVQLGDRFTFLIIARGDRLGLRLYDRDAPARRDFTDIPTFPAHGAWQLAARYEPYTTPRKIDHPTVLGTHQPAEVPGVVTFTLAGRDHHLTPILEHGPRGDELLFVFRDLTSGVETYTGGRFLVTPLPQGGELVLDFNRAHNPPCAFTPYATCPVPLPENRLATRIEAGEKTPTDPH